jgi:hypothetical protein
VKYIQYHGVWDLEELYDLDRDPGEMRNLIDDSAYLQAKIDLRRRLYAALASRDGRHVVPYTERTSAGLIYRSREGAEAAPFPPEWLKAPNDVNRMIGLYPDSPDKLEAQKTGKPYFPAPARGAGAATR